ncbi:MAG: ComEC/Rec2 family competence protein, partial [Vulcanimicrobiaceae bacterium]
VHPRAGTIWRSDDGVTIRFYGPAQPYFAAGARAVDENSLVFLLTYGNARMLFTGDAGEQEEARLLLAGVDLRADVLKVGHHGSRFASSAAFLDAVRPKIAIISAGRDNRFGLPAPATIERLTSIGARIFRTDIGGAITIRSDGRSIDAESFILDRPGARLKS